MKAPDVMTSPAITVKSSASVRDVGKLFLEQRIGAFPVVAPGPRGRLRLVRELLTDPALTTFFFVTLAEALPIAVVTRFIQWFKDFGIPVGGVLVNMVIDSKSLGPDSAEFVKNRVAMQQEHMKTIWREFDDSVRAIVPLFETEIRGVPMLLRLCDAIFAADGAKPAAVAPVGRPQQVGAGT